MDLAIRLPVAICVFVAIIMIGQRKIKNVLAPWHPKWCLFFLLENTLQILFSL